ncbi:DNA internalization-related competence protein ComEC/Rec2 [Aliiglaciecola lipolytica]|uniref:Competence protein ComEC n=1 Tax=Aliiglaciecola lipolytica E3 TaxID=1127673 RepID=K6XSH9_9ALTE|nr:DNA internalization-related competence protein ComEC/Rec2 [Aliiglaciecola lipolytica]GAC14641.1 competence protein ComEC [Aliiglaciecola lipolytica E3]
MTISVSSLVWPHLPSPYLLPVFLVIAWLTTRYSKNALFFCKLNVSAMICITSTLFAIVWMASVGHWRVNWQLSEQDIRQIKQVTGSIETIVSDLENTKFNLVISSINGKTSYTQPRVRLNWKLPAWPLKQGQRVNLSVKLKPVHGLANDGGFNYQKWLISNNIVATGYVLNDSAELQENNVTVRQRLIDKFKSIELRHSSWIAAMTFGDRSGLTQQNWQMMQTTGVAHLVAISGLHLGVVASLCYFIFTQLLRLFGRIVTLPQRVNYQYISLLITLIATFFYAYIAGFSLPTLRAWIMLTLWALMLFSKRYITFKWFIILNMFIFILIQPMSLLSASFWLSFGAIAFIAVVSWLWPVNVADIQSHRVLNRSIQVSKSIIRLQLMLSLLMLPVVAVYFSMVSVSSPIVNVIAVPVVTLIIVPLCLLGCFSLLFSQNWAAWFFSWVDRLLDFCLIGLHYFQQLSWSRFELPGMPIIVWFSVFIATIAVFVPLNRRIKLTAIIGLLPFLSYFLPSQSTSWKLHVLDVGQGLSVLVEQDGRALLYDTGAAFPSRFNMSEAVILPLLKHENINQLDWMVISHFDNDHAGGLPQLLSGINVGAFLSNQDMCHNQLVIKWEKLTIRGLWPEIDHRGKGNDFSCVLQISDGIQSVILPGDISKYVEKRLVTELGNKLNTDILVAAHHGSDTSSLDSFIQATSPQYAIFSQGYLNRWDFPKQQVVNRFVNQKVELMSTAQSGQITFTFSRNGKPIKVSRFRQDPMQSWFSRYLWP